MNTIFKIPVLSDSRYILLNPEDGIQFHSVCQKCSSSYIDAFGKVYIL